MPQPRKYPTNAARQAAYRRRKASADAAVRDSVQALQARQVGTPGTRFLVARIMQADAQAQ